MTSKYIQTLFGHNINDGINYKVVGHNFGMVRPRAQGVYIEQRDADPVDSGGYTVSDRQNAVQIEIVNYANRHALADQLLVWCKRGTEGPVVSKFPDDGDLYQLDVRSQDIFPDPDIPILFTVLLSSGQTNWRAVVADAISWSASGTSSAQALSIGGKDETVLSITITGTAAPAGIWLYQDLCQFINPATALGTVALCIELDTAALVAAGKLRANCWDLRLNVGGQSNWPRYIDSPNTDHTKVWFTVDNVRAGFDLALYPGTAQVETATAVGTISGAGNAQVVVTAAGMTGSPKTLNVPVLNGDSAAVWAAKVRAALDGDAAVSAMFDVAGAGTQIILRRSSPAANDSTLNISLANGTCTGIVADAFSDNTTAGSLYSIAGSGPISTLEFDHTPTVKAKLKAAPFQFLIVHGTEWITVRKTRTTLTDYRVTVVEREVNGTTAQAHNGGDVFSFIQYPIIVSYGNLAAGNPATGDSTYNNKKPVFDLAQSDNSKTVLTTSTVFYDPTLPQRPGSWKMFLSRKGANSNNYRFKGAASSGQPALGIKAAAYLKNGSWIADQITMGWMIEDKRGFSNIASATGRSYRTDTLWPAVTKLQASADGGATWDEVFSESSPGSPDVFANWPSHTNVAVPDTSSTLLRLVVSGVSEKRANGYQLFECLTLSIDHTTVPTLTLLGEQDNYHVELRINNSASYQGQSISDTIDVLYPLRINRPLVIDGEEGEATYDGMNVHGAISLDDDSRTVLLRGLPGTNTITVQSLVAGQSIGTATIAASAYARRP